MQATRRSVLGNTAEGREPEPCEHHNEADGECNFDAPIEMVLSLEQEDEHKKRQRLRNLIRVKLPNKGKKSIQDDKERGRDNWIGKQRVRSHVYASINVSEQNEDVAPAPTRETDSMAAFAINSIDSDEEELGCEEDPVIVCNPLNTVDSGLTGFESFASKKRRLSQSRKLTKRRSVFKLFGKKNSGHLPTITEDVSHEESNGKNATREGEEYNYERPAVNDQRIEIFPEEQRSEGGNLKIDENTKLDDLLGFLSTSLNYAFSELMDTTQFGESTKGEVGPAELYSESLSGTSDISGDTRPSQMTDITGIVRFLSYVQNEERGFEVLVEDFEKHGIRNFDSSPKIHRVAMKRGQSFLRRVSSLKKRNTPHSKPMSTETAVEISARIREIESLFPHEKVRELENIVSKLAVE